VKLFLQAKALLTTDRFNRARCTEVLALYAKASGEERVRIAQILESQIALTKGPEDMEWLMRQVRAAGK
jgi:hypothetical protein